MTTKEHPLYESGLLFKYVYLTILVDEETGGLASEYLAEFAKHSNSVMINRYQCIVEGTVLDLLIEAGPLIFNSSFNVPFMSAFEKVLDEKEFIVLKDYLYRLAENRN